MKVRFILFILLTFSLGGCVKNSEHPVPNLPFDITIDLALPSYNSLIGVSGWAYVNVGSKGVIVYRRGIDEFIAFDRHSPADINGECDYPLFPDNNNYLVLKDSCNNATFSLYVKRKAKSVNLSSIHLENLGALLLDFNVFPKSIAINGAIVDEKSINHWSNIFENINNDVNIII